MFFAGVVPILYFYPAEMKFKRYRRFFANENLEIKFSKKIYSLEMKL